MKIGLAHRNLEATRRADRGHEREGDQAVMAYLRPPAGLAQKFSEVKPNVARLLTGAQLACHGR